MTHHATTKLDAGSEHEIRSSFADDADMAELVAIFVEDAPIKIERLSNALDSQNWDQVRVFAHQLKGAAAGYGFTPLSDLARELETSAIRGTPAETADRSEQVIEYLSAIRT